MVDLQLNDAVFVRTPCSLHDSLRASLRMPPRVIMTTVWSSLDSRAAIKHCEGSAWWSTSVTSAGTGAHTGRTRTRRRTIRS
eukprot:scaffold126749_cov60-Phaeocystis_antarctica.AAC.2